MIVFSILSLAVAAGAVEQNRRELVDMNGVFVAEDECSPLVGSQGERYLYRRLIVQDNEDGLILNIDRDKIVGNGMKVSSPIKRHMPVTDGPPGTDHTSISRDGKTYMVFKGDVLTELTLSRGVLTYKINLKGQDPEDSWTCEFQKVQ